MQQTIQASCCHEQMPISKLMVCTSLHCVENDKIGCPNCFLLRHIHNDLVEFKRMEEINSKLKPLKALASDKRRL